MKIIMIDNYARESVADKLVAENTSNEYFGNVMVAALQKDSKCSVQDWFRLVPDDYRLSRGMADIVGEPEAEG